ncbi:MAG: PAS domain-containing sensor histidine kinase [Candidatus Kariarchaeaceae archaeon]|jgi:PAS domain S-box-containing protein
MNIEKELGLLKKVLEKVEIGVYIRTIKDRKIIWANDRFYELHNVSRKDVIGFDIHELLTETGRRQWEKIDFQSIEGKNYELEAKTPLGPKNIVVSMGKLDNKHIYGFVRDKSGDYASYKALLQSEMHYTRLIQGSKGGIVMTDSEETIILLNDSLASMLGYKDRNDLIGRNAVELVSPEDFEKIREETQKRMKGEYSSYQVKLRCQDGKMKEVTLSVGPITNYQDEYLGSLSIVTDISEGVKYEKMREKYTQIIHHELKSPLSIINQSIDLLKIKCDQEDLTDVFSIVERNIKRISQQIDELSDFDQIERGYFSLNIQQNKFKDFKQMIESDLAFFKNNHRLITHFTKYQSKGNKAILLTFDPERVTQLVYNLLSNALNHSSPETKVIFECHWRKTGLTISVKDSGQGIKPQHRQQMYEPFYTHESRFYRKGTGLGLFIVKSIVDAHSGEIKYESESGKGSTFEVTIPQQ